jgi:hypothetical protein
MNDPWSGLEFVRLIHRCSRIRDILVGPRGCPLEVFPWKNHSNFCWHGSRGHEVIRFVCIFSADPRWMHGPPVLSARVASTKSFSEAWKPPDVQIVQDHESICRDLHQNAADSSQADQGRSVFVRSSHSVGQQRKGPVKTEAERKCDLTPMTSKPLAYLRMLVPYGCCTEKHLFVSVLDSLSIWK